MIRNAEELCDHGERDLRRALVDVVEAALADVHPDSRVRRAVERDGETLRVDGEAYDLAAVERVFVLGAGKGSLAVVEALVDVLGPRVDEAFVVEKRGQGRSVDGVEVVEAGHPLPDEDGREAARRVRELAAEAGPDDLAFVCITGGASALLPAPAGDVTLDELRRTTELLLESGAPIEAINAVRKHLSTLKGGRLAETIAPARPVTLVVVDEVAGDPWGPTVPDGTTFADAVSALEQRGLWEAAPASVRAHLERGREDSSMETPTTADLDAAAPTVVLADATDACEAAAERADALGYEAAILSTTLEGESREIGTCLAGIAREAATHRRPVEPPCALVTGGETTVTIDGDAGEGGPNQEFALSFARGVAGRAGVAAVAVGTDGTDGPTDLAGGLVDGETAARADKRGVDLFGALAAHDAAPALRTLGDAVETGATGTNVMDLRVVLIG